MEIDAANTVFAAPLADFGTPHGVTAPSRAFDAGVWLPLAAGGFGCGALSTPSASIENEEANPLASPTTRGDPRH